MYAGIQYMFTHQAEQFQVSPNGDEEHVIAERQSVLFAPKIRSLAAALSTPEAVVTLLDAKASTDLPIGFYASNQDRACRRRWYVNFHCNRESRWCRGVDRKLHTVANICKLSQASEALGSNFAKGRYIAEIMISLGNSILSEWFHSSCLRLTPTGLSGSSIVATACYFGNSDTVQVLIERKCSINQRTVLGWVSLGVFVVVVTVPMSL